MDNNTAIRVLVVDNHSAARAGCTGILAQAPDMAVDAEASNASDAYRLTATEHFDVVVLELHLPGMSGLEACARISRWSNARVLVFSMLEQPLFVQRALTAGAGGYLTKRAPASELEPAVRTVAAGRRYLDPRIRDAGTAPVPLAQLSPREFEIFRLLANDHDIQDIARTLFLSAKTVANNASRLRTKLGVASTAQLTRLALRLGIITV